MAPYGDKYSWKMWPLLYREIDRICNNQLWIDLDKESIKFLKSKSSDFRNSDLIFFDMNNFEQLDYKPDVIIFWEVIEHLMNLEIAFANIKTIMKENTLLIITTPNTYYYWSIKNIFFWKELMHEDHKVYFSYWYLINLLKFNWIDVVKWYFTFLDRWKSKLNIFWKIWSILNLIFRRIILFISIWFSENITLITKIKWK